MDILRKLDRAIHPVRTVKSRRSIRHEAVPKPIHWTPGTVSVNGRWVLDEDGAWHPLISPTSRQ